MRIGRNSANNFNCCGPQLNLMPQSLVVADSQKVKVFKDELTRLGLFDKRRKIGKSCQGFEIPLVKQTSELGSSFQTLDELLQSSPFLGASVVESTNESFIKSTCVRLQSALKMWNIDLDQFPSRWSVYPPMVLFSSGSFEQLKAVNCSDEFYDYLLRNGVFGRKDLTHIAVNAPVDEHDIVRKPHIIPVFGDFGQFNNDYGLPSEQEFSNAFWVSCIQNSIYQTWCPMYTMFSRGNITEKARVLNRFADQAPIKDHVIVDMYAGIGYFTFSYAAQQPSRIFCWEINPWSVEALIRGAKHNGFPVKLVTANEEYLEEDGDMIVVFLENNENAPRRLNQVQIMNNLTHVNLGLLPDSKQAFNSVIFLALQSRKAILHIHENVQVNKLKSWLTDTARCLDSIISKLDHNELITHKVTSLDLEKIKTFAPDVYHVCGDFEVYS